MSKVIFWMWLSDVAGSIGFVGGLCAVILALTIVLGGFVTALEAGELRNQNALPTYRRFIGWMLLGLGLPVLIALFTPSKDTLRLVAAASAVDVAAETTLGKKAAGAIEAVLDRITKEAK